MAFGTGENPDDSVSAQLDQVDYPVWREQLAKMVMDNTDSVDVINLIKSLPQSRYESKDQAMRDLGEAARRFAMGNSAASDDDGVRRDRRNIGKDAVEQAPAPLTRHP